MAPGRPLACLALALAAHAALAWALSSTARPHRPSGQARPAAVLTLVAPPRQPVDPAPVPPKVVPGASRAVADRVAAIDPPADSGRSLFKAPGELDRPALPRSAPDTAMLEGLPWSGLPIRLRLFVDVTGAVVDVAVLQASDDPEVVARVRRMFMAMAFIPARANGADTPSYKDIEVVVGSA